MSVKHYTHPKNRLAVLTVHGCVVSYHHQDGRTLTYKAGSGHDAEGLALRMGFKLYVDCVQERKPFIIPANVSP